jgi:hypothetical protein
LELTHIKNPHKVQEIIASMLRKGREEEKDEPTVLEELYLLLSKIKKDFGGDETKKILEKYLKDNL